MTSLNKILVAVVVILAVALGIMTYEYLNMKQNAKNNSEMILQGMQEMQDSNERINELEKELRAR